VAKLDSFEQLRHKGLEAYGAFHRLVVDRSALDSWTREEPRIAAEFERLAQTLPPPHAQLPFRILVNIAGHAVGGELENHHQLEGAADRDDGAALRAWFSEARGLIERLAPEALGADVLWLRWTPPANGAPFAAGRVSLDDVWDAASGFAKTAGASQAGPLSNLLALLRDWAEDLHPLLDALQIPVDGFLDDLVSAARDERDLTAFSPELRRAEERGRTELDLPTSAWTILAALAGAPSAAQRFLPPQAAVLDAIRRLAAGHQTAPEAPQRQPPREGRPSTIVTTDAWTDRDQLEHALYADAITSSILAEETRAPLVIGIKAPWGAGKTSLMRMIQRRLDPDALSTVDKQLDENRLGIWEVLWKTRRTTPEGAAQRLTPEAPAAGGRRITVWFNAWKYQSGEQLWAGLAHAILSQVTNRLSAADRDRLWAGIQVRRVRLPELRRSFYRYVAVRTLPYALVFPVAAVVVLAVWLLNPDFLQGAGIIGAIAAVASTGIGLVRSAMGEVTNATPHLVEEPDYQSRLGFLHLVDSDMRRILRVSGATRDRPFVVFIDDLDRCSYTTVAQVIEALNVFLAGEFENCIFVIAMEPDLVAAQIHVAYEKLFQRLDDGTGTDLGWKFLEKMVQLPIALPEPQQQQVAQYVDSLLRVEAEELVADLDEDAPEVVAARREIRAAETTGSLEGIAAALEQVKAQRTTDETTAADDAVLQKAARLEFADRFSDAHAREMLLKHAFELSGNPREIKRFINLYRFYAYIDFWRVTQGLESPGLDGVGKLTRLAIGWPNLLSALGRDVSVNGEMQTLLASLERAGDDGDAWGAAVARAPKRFRPQLASAELRDVIGRAPDVGTRGASFL
jgi:hypothetical protein